MPHEKIHHPRIVLITGIILIVITLLAGATVFIVMSRHAEELLSKSLQSTLQSRVHLTQAEIRAGFDRTMIVATRPLMIDIMQRVSVGVDDGVARMAVNKVAQSFLTGFTGIALFDKDGREVARAGSFTQKSALTVPLNVPGRVQLMWDGQLLLHVVVDIQQAGRVMGKVMTETLLPTTTGALKGARSLGETGELRLCAPLGLNKQCFPSTFSPRVETLSRRGPDGNLVPMAYALAGASGFIATRDYRNHEVVAAYAPVGDLGLGMSELGSILWRGKLMILYQLVRRFHEVYTSSFIYRRV